MFLHFIRYQHMHKSFNVGFLKLIICLPWVVNQLCLLFAYLHLNKGPTGKQRTHQSQNFVMPNFTFLNFVIKVFAEDYLAERGNVYMRLNESVCKSGVDLITQLM